MMNDPQVGDRFCEMYTFYVYVVHRNGDLVVTLEADGTHLTATARLSDDKPWITPAVFTGAVAKEWKPYCSVEEVSQDATAGLPQDFKDLFRIGLGKE